MKSKQKALLCACFFHLVALAQHNAETKSLNKRDGETISQYETSELEMSIPSSEALYIDAKTSVFSHFSLKCLKFIKT